MSPIRPHSLDHETIERLRELVATTYAGRDDLYEAARNLKDEELVAICRKLAEELAASSTHLAQILASPCTARSRAERAMFEPC